MKMNNPEAALLERIHAARAEPTEPTEEAETVESTEEVTEEVIEAIDETTPDEAQAEPEESIDEETPEEMYVDIDGREISLSDIKEWEQGTLRQADYTKKTQELADKRKEFESEQATLATKNTNLNEQIASLEVLTAEKEDETNWDELREYDPGEYLKQRELQDKRKAALESAKQYKSGVSDEELQASANAEVKKLFDSNPHWVKDGVETDAYKNEMANVQTYLKSLGYTEEAQRGILLTGHGQIFIDAAKFHTQQNANAVIKKKVKKAPIVTKPGGARSSNSVTAIERAEKAHQKYGTVETALALRKAKRNAA